jgi:predicted DNA-binding transcriptional regulator AlpA
MEGAERMASEPKADQFTIPTLERIGELFDQKLSERLSELPANDADKPLDRRELAAFLGISLSTLDKEIAAGLPHFYVSDSRRFIRSEVLSYLRTRSAGGGK